jgi:hypothetical protein
MASKNAQNPIFEKGMLTISLISVQFGMEAFMIFTFECYILLRII